MEQTFRASMNWLHTWAGVVVGGVLFAVFWMGTLSVFDREIDRWMAPVTRLEASQSFPIAALQPSLDAAIAARSPTWFATLPSDRDPTVRMSWRGPAGPVVQLASPITGAALSDPGTWAGTRFLYPFHYMLHIRLWQLGLWIVGLAGMVMLAMCVSGVIVHRRIFADFFTVRAEKKPRRLILDLHNVIGVAGFPFHVVITLSGLIVFFATYFPATWQIPYGGDRQAFNREVFDTFQRPRLGKPGGPVALAAIDAEVRRLWEGESPRYYLVRHLGDAAGYVQVARSAPGSILGVAEVIYFDATSGAVLHHRVANQPVQATQRFIAGLHLVQFRHWTVRTLYFGLGLAGCVLIATGYLFWLESRRRRHAALGLRGVRIVEGLTIGSVTGILIATLAFFVVNRLLPLGATFAGYDRAALEIWTFYIVWLATFAYAWAWPGRAWLDQCRTIAVLACSAVLLNWLTTGDHPIRSLAHRHLWPIAGMDLLLLAGAAVAALTNRRLKSGRQ